jgi:hypothetical protein
MAQDDSRDDRFLLLERDSMRNSSSVDETALSRVDAAP